jgi:2-amino-4-hydroxy-6-hydroxymethyldihydropteridine diphosphokinase
VQANAEITETPDVFVSIGSNIDPDRNIPEALEMLARQTRLLGVSVFYRTSPLNRPEQSHYLNGVCRLHTALPPRALKFEFLRTVEATLGRVRTADIFAARPIDLDIALYGDWVIRDTDLVVPDPDITIRPFLAWPLYELAPATVLPDSGRALADVVRQMGRDDLVPEIEFTKALRARLKL